VRCEKEGVRLMGVRPPSLESSDTSDPARLGGREPGRDPGPLEAGRLPPRLPGRLSPDALYVEREVTGAEALRLLPCRWNEDVPPSSLKDESGVPALKDDRPIPELLAVLSLTLIMGPELGSD